MKLTFPPIYKGAIVFSEQLVHNASKPALYSCSNLGFGVECRNGLRFCAHFVYGMFSSFSRVSMVLYKNVSNLDVHT